jgi:tRNA threonylcarbamoyladenosine biosynthesis protein TsaE
VSDETIRSRGTEETERLAARLAVELVAGDVVLLAGELGTGKTTFVRGAARALGVTGPVSSPTFTLGRLYEGREGLLVAHLDLFRVGPLADEEPGMLDEYLRPDAIGFVEWPRPEEPELRDARLLVSLEHRGGDEREIRVSRR